ncbi:tRNA(Ile)-lysidine synthase [Thermoanaerobacterium xylanolyticum LX-11]|uniref:tRNA(Ile)-lysidine synthase n=1 Tax=Thermoanaerobacterium xylanolyticum (strain ATCC 49914 / DSM 7097 / LX-11) TaxID=858215 RepID=F6BG95_THEXL|nr:tRNA lysidine(34) synthetase TilS [Thermoanaerobacterium xylanolyticum]AEF16313.1 tRNA(Ile)-lysidine synthase [Thermoanaerobacterium xylanolyticum LX-11]
MIDSFEKTIKEYKMIEKGDKIVVGVSGGPDSICLLNLLLEIKERYKLKLFVVHVNHMLRGADADSDALFVEKFCKGINIPFFLFKEDVRRYAEENGLSEEAAGREIRYSAFNKVLKEVGGNKIAIAHNKNDVAETVLLNILRGAGTTGLVGIKPVNGCIIRPLIQTKRREIIDYLNSKNLEFVEDVTNKEDAYRRNRIRLKLIPFIEEYFDIDMVENLYRTSQIVLDDEDYLSRESEKIFNEIADIDNGNVKLDIDGIKKLHSSIKRRVIRLAYKKLKGDFNQLAFKHVEDVLDIMDKQTSSKIDLPFEIEVIKSYNNLIFRKRNFYEKRDFSEVKLNIPGITDGGCLGVYKAEIIDRESIESLNLGRYRKFFDADLIDGDVVVRHRRIGDCISPLNMRGTKTLKKYFIDEKIPREERDKIPLLAIGNTILWIVGYRISEKYKVRDSTKKILSIEYIEQD